MPAGNYWVLLVSVLIEAVSFAMFSPLMDALTIISIDSKERARINSTLSVVAILLTFSFGLIAGQLSGHNRIYPFILNIFLLFIGMGFVSVTYSIQKQKAT